jgi:RHS repeat-associated protein
MRWVNGNTPAVWYARNLTRDAATGWITASSDTSGLSTPYVYDVLGRVTSITPPGEVATSVSYPTTKETIATRNGGTGLITYQEYDYDGLGRLIRERRAMPGSQYAKRFSLFDPAGHQYFRSEWIGDTVSEGVSPDKVTSCAFSTGGFSTLQPSSAPGTYSLCFDPFGRPQQVVGSSFSSLTTVDRKELTTSITGQTFVSTWYSDTREATTVACLNGALLSDGTCGAGGANSTTTAAKDAFGRVTSVTEPNNVMTSYTYDVNSKLTQVQQPGLQNRAFVYDLWGFLRSEMTPEKSTVNYNLYNSLGNVVTETEPDSTVRNRTYDFAARLTGITATTTLGTTRFLTSCYDGTSSSCVDGTANSSGGDRPLGKLTRRTGFNYLLGTAAAPKVIEDFAYLNPAGRLSSRTVSVGTGGENLSVTENWTYNGLGLEATHNQLRPTGSTFQVTTGYDAGLTTSLTAPGQPVVSSAAYQPSGALAGYTTGNAITTTIAQDGFLARPLRIFSNAGFATGTYSYDGVGDVLAMGTTDQFAYDSLSRLTSATLSGTTQSFSYDTLGNMLTKGSTSYSVVQNRVMSSTVTGQTPVQANYDGRGNLTAYGTETLMYDALDRQYEDDSPSGGWDYIFDGAGERLVKIPGSNMVLRREMAKYLVQATNGTAVPSSSCSTPLTFADVSCSDSDWGWIQALWNAGFTNGCNPPPNPPPLDFCPDGTVNRAQMAKFFVSARLEQPVPDSQCVSGQETFEDVPCGYQSIFWGYIQRFYLDSITTGCGTDMLTGRMKFCPLDNVTELQMITFLTRSWGNYQGVPRGSNYTFRDASNRVTSEYTGTTRFGGTTAGRDNIYLGNLLMGTYVSSVLSGTLGWQFYTSDHLGTPRSVTDPAGNVLETRKYWPYGEDVIANPLTAQRIRFASMERDTEASRYNDHARHYEFNLGRFLSPDKLGGRVTDPQSWNRYAYSRNNPLLYVDRDGRLAAPFHFIVTLVAGIRSGLGFFRSVGLAWHTAAVDFRPGSQGKDAASANVHAMSGKLPDGRYQTAEEARAGTAKSMEESRARGDTESSLHTTQDDAVPLHTGHEWHGFGFNLETLKHILGDLFPSPQTVKNAYDNTVKALQPGQPNPPGTGENPSQDQEPPKPPDTCQQSPERCGDGRWQRPDQ